RSAERSLAHPLGNQEMTIMNAKSTRRKCIRTTAGAAAAAALAPRLLRAAQATQSDKMIGMQIGAVSFVDEGVGEVLEILQSKGAVNTAVDWLGYAFGFSSPLLTGRPRLYHE